MNWPQTGSPLFVCTCGAQAVLIISGRATSEVECWAVVRGFRMSTKQTNRFPSVNELPQVLSHSCQKYFWDHESALMKDWTMLRACSFELQSTLRRFPEQGR